MSYTVTIDPSGVRLIVGESIPLADFAALLEVWSSDQDEDDPVLMSTEIPKHVKIYGRIVAAVGRRDQIDAMLSAYRVSQAQPKEVAP
jgi:hypothetical protein